MPTWRDAASSQAQDDLDGLLEPALGFAQEQLAKHGKFHPYAVAVDTAGRREMVAADLGREPSSPADVITALIEALSARRDDFRAVAIIADTTAPAPNDGAIRVTLEHREGTALAVHLPYVRRGVRRTIAYGELSAVVAFAHIW